MRQSTASKSGLLLQCQMPFSTEPTEEEEVSEAAGYGTAFHKLLEWRVREAYRLTKREMGILASDADTPNVKLLRAHVETAFECLTAFIAEHKLHVVSAEAHRAMRIRMYGKRVNIENRITGFTEATHTYALEEGEIGGSDDLYLEGGGMRVVLDYKTGSWGEYHSPAKLLQMRTLALMTNATHVAILHTPRDAPPVVYFEPIDVDVLRQHAVSLRKAMRRIGDGSLRPGPECKWCPVRASCPMQDGELLKRASALVKTSVNGPLAKPTSLGELHYYIGEMSNLLERARFELRARVEDGAVIQRPDGKVLELREYNVERISKKRFVEALGEAGAEKEFRRLRKLKVLQEVPETRLVAVKGE